LEEGSLGGSFEKAVKKKRKKKENEKTKKRNSGLVLQTAKAVESGKGNAKITVRNNNQLGKAFLLFVAFFFGFISNSMKEKEQSVGRMPSE
jgi:hypothetical protein